MTLFSFRMVFFLSSSSRVFRVVSVRFSYGIQSWSNRILSSIFKCILQYEFGLFHCALSLPCDCILIYLQSSGHDDFSFIRPVQDRATISASSSTLVFETAFFFNVSHLRFNHLRFYFRQFRRKQFLFHCMRAIRLFYWFAGHFSGRSTNYIYFGAVYFHSA